MVYDDDSLRDDPGETPTARNFVLEKLGSADSPLSPAELAKEYGCTNGHVRNLLSDLMDEGVVERPRHGKYVLASDGGTGHDPEGAADSNAKSPGNADGETNDTAPNIQGEKDAGSMAEPASSADQQETDSNPSMIGTASTAAIGGLGLLSSTDRERVVFLVVVVTLLVIGYMLLSPSDGTDGQTRQEPREHPDDDPNDSSDVPLLGEGGEY